MNNNERKGNGRFLFGMGAFLFGALLIIAVTPSVLAQSIQTTQAKDQEFFQSLYEKYQDIMRHYVDPVDPKVLYEGALKGMFESLKDPHTYFLDNNEFQRLTDTTTGEIAGIGAYIDKQRDKEGTVIADGFIEVVAPFDGSPAARAGLVAGDLIMEVDAKSTTPMSSSEASTNIRGKPGTVVKLKILRGKSLTLDFAIKREIVEIPTVKYAMIGSTAYLRLLQFTPKSTEQMRLAIAELKRQGMKSMVLDLRNNPGGVLPGAIEIANLFFDSGVLVSTKSRVASENHVYSAVPGQMMVDKSMPMVVLVNSGSASASEIVSGALKDRGRAAFVGEKTYGKGSVQTVRDMGDVGYRMTIARYYTPADICIDKIGIMPDIEIKEAPFTRDEEYSYLKLLELDLVSKFIDANPKPTADQISAFQATLPGKNITLAASLVKRLIVNEVNRRTNVAPVYDLEFDSQLRKAMELIETNTVQATIDARPKPVASAEGRTVKNPVTGDPLPLPAKK
jgi:carboxyl-terminal processing protease